MNRDRRPQILHVSKFPPSPSGIALYASTFHSVLGEIGEVTKRWAPPDPITSQGFASATTGLAQGFLCGHYDFVHIEVGGRSLHEFYFALGVAIRRRVPMVVTCHDSPSIAGASMLFTALDRRGLRRIGMALSRHVGIRLERFMLRRCSLIVTLTEAAAGGIEEAYGVAASAIPHIITTDAFTSKEHSVFVPGYFDDPDGLIAVISSVAEARRLTSQDWSVTVGACPAELKRRVYDSLAPETQKIVNFVGFVDETDLLRIYATSAIVVRLHGDEGKNRFAASGPLCWAVAYGCLCITNDKRAGANELASTGLIIQCSIDAGLVTQVILEWEPAVAVRLAGQARHRLGLQSVAARYRSLLRESGVPTDLADETPASRTVS